ncbi:hypothetical protein BGZ94_000953 [Podila epigama]|nr:hypothetical protein BGZ94_000953 [Podila epigama]
MSSKPHPGRISTSSGPPSPVLTVNLSRDNSLFYTEPTFEAPKKRPSGLAQSLLPSPTLQTVMLDIKALPDVPSTNTTASEANQQQQQPIVNLTAATPIQPHQPKLDLEGHQPFKVNTAEILSRPPSSASAGLTESERRGLEKIKRLSSEGYPGAGYTLSREGSPVNGQSQSDERTNERLRAYRNKIEELEALVTCLKIDLDSALEDQARTAHAFNELNTRHADVVAKLDKRNKEYDVMSKNYLEHVRLIRATDDDHSTIMERLTQLKVGIEQMVRIAQGQRSVNLQRKEAIEHFKGSGKLATFPISEDKLEPYHLNLYMESVFMSTLVNCFFDRPLSCIFDFNKGFQDIYNWMYERNDKSAVRWRQQLCQMLAQDPNTKVKQAQEVDVATAALAELFSKVYINSNVSAKIRDLCNKAFELAVAMIGMEAAISPVYIPLETPFDEESMATSLKSNCEGKVAMVIFPAFRDKVSVFNIPPKVWCH